MVVPAVSHAVWKLDDGRIGIVLVNPEPAEHHLDMDLTPLLRTRANSSIREFSATGTRRLHNTPHVELTVAPLDMVLLEIAEQPTSDASSK